jgi:hypothetical protein
MANNLYLIFQQNGRPFPLLQSIDLVIKLSKKFPYNNSLKTNIKKPLNLMLLTFYSILALSWYCFYSVELLAMQ